MTLAAWAIPIHGAPAIVTAIRANPHWTVEFQKEAYLERGLKEHVAAVYRDYNRLTGGMDETWYHEAIAAEFHAEQTLAMIERALVELQKPGHERFAAGVVQSLRPMKAWYTQLVRQLRVHRAGLTPKTPEEPLELMPTRPAQIPRFDG
jgi:hypothetical protein